MSTCLIKTQRIRTLSLIYLLFPALCYSQEFSEICPSNHSIYNDVNEGYADWFEIHNNTGLILDLDDYTVTDSLSNPEKWEIESLLLPINGYALIMAKRDTEFSTTAPISLTQKGVTLYLFDDDQVLVDSIAQPEVHMDDSYGLVNGQYYYFEDPTPGYANTTTGYNGYTNPPIFDISDGLIEEDEVSISADPGATIYYALNGTNPLDAFTYTGPIPISNTKNIKAIAVADSLLPSIAIYETYFKNLSHELSVVNLTVDSIAMFDTIVGIYMEGPNADPNFPYFGANFWKDTAIDVHYTYYDQNLNRKENLDCELKIHGGTVSTTQPLRSFRLVARDRFEQESFEYPYFDNKNVSEFKRLLLRNSGSDYNYTHLKDGIIHNFCLDHNLKVDVQAYKPVVVYINGHFWGVMNLREKIDEYYPQTNYLVNPDSVNMLEENDLKIIAGDSASFTDLLNYVASNDMSDQYQFEIVSEQLDVESFVDYFIMETYVNNRDWPYNNLKVWNGNSEFPKWRYLLSDLDAGMKYYGQTQLDLHFVQDLFGTWGDANVHIVLFRQMMENQEYKRYFVNRYADLLNTVLQPNYMLDYIYAGKERIDPDMVLHFEKWWVADWEANYTHYDTFLVDRVDIVREDLQATFPIGEDVGMYFNVYPSNAGTVQINTIELDSFPFLPRYYANNEIDVSVTPKDGEVFLYWENLRTGDQFENESLKFFPVEGDSLVAVFETNEDLYHLGIYPNPASVYTTVVFSVPESLDVTFIISDMQGKIIGEYPQGTVPYGTHRRWIDTGPFEQGNYALTMITPLGKETTKILVVK